MDSRRRRPQTIWRRKNYSVVCYRTKQLEFGSLNWNVYYPCRGLSTEKILVVFPVFFQPFHFRFFVFSFYSYPNLYLSQGLTVLEYLVGHGSERVIDDIREHAYQISVHYSYSIH